MGRKLLLIELNEINFDLVNQYLYSTNDKAYKNIRYLLNNYRKLDTYSENNYENLEPWIQWASVHLGKKFDEHKIFRLGDIIYHKNQIQIFEHLEKKGIKIGAICPMNTANKLNNPGYFIPDPWTQTRSDDSIFSKNVTKMLQQSVNENSSGKISSRSIITILQIFIKTFSIKNSIKLISLIFFLLIRKWKRPLVLDYIIHLLNIHFLKKKSLILLLYFLMQEHIYSIIIILIPNI
jgi:hypothetical protein